LSERENPGETDAGETPLLSFIVRIWVESSAREGDVPQWRGSVQHIPSGDKRYVDDMEEIVAFFESHLARLGIRVRSRARTWWCRLWRLC
jgi:hypothetical protein